MKVNRTVKNWLKKWRMYIFVVVAISTVFGVSIIMTALRLLGVEIPFPMVWTILAFVIGILILIFSLIIIGYLLLMVKSKTKGK